MPTLRDHFDTVHQKEIKGKGGAVVARVDYVGWSQVADRLDEAAPGWSFTIMGIGEDWAHGRLTLPSDDGTARSFENIGYAENADQDWKKEVLKDAASDAFKRCAALAGVARYLYDKDAPTTGRSSAPQVIVSRTSNASAVRSHVVDTDLLEDDEANPFDSAPPPADKHLASVNPPDVRCPFHPNREPREGKYGLYCTGTGGNGPLNAKGYCEWKAA